MNCEDIKYYSTQVTFKPIYLRETKRSIEYQIGLIVEGKNRSLSGILYTQGFPPIIDKNNPFLQSMWVKFLTEQGCTSDQIRDSFRGP